MPEATAYLDGHAGLAAAASLNQQIWAFLRHEKVTPESLQHRVFLDAARFAELTLTEPDPRIRYAAIDFRVHAMGGHVRWHVDVCLDSRLPDSPELRPAELTPAADDSLIEGPFSPRREALARRARAAEQLLGDYFSHAEFRVLDRTYLQPDFYICVPEQTMDNPVLYCQGPLEQFTNVVSSSMLKVANLYDDVVATAVLNGHFLVSRRVSRASGPSRAEYAPLYTIFPATSVDADERECSIRELVLGFAEIEVRSGALLDDLRRDLYVWNNHLEVYYTTAARGARLWDALATHMPVRRWRQLGRVHTAMELMHQMLLQGTADLAHLVSRAHRCPARVHAASAELGDLYDDMFTERRIGGHSGGIRAAICETGLIGRIARSSQEITDLATQVQQNYEDLLGAITKAFDERRVRESDALQRASVLLGVSLGLVGIVTVADATVDMRTAGWSWLSGTAAPQLGAGLSLAIGTVLLASAFVMVGRLLQAGRLGSRKFRRHYGAAFWDFLTASCTESLEEFKIHASPEDWAKLDARLAASFAELWDQATAMIDIHQRGRNSRDINVISRLIEQWCLHGLLATERARRIYRYKLPRLAAMYRCVSRLPGSFLELHYLRPGPAPVNILSRQEFARTLAHSLGIEPSKAYEIDAWLIAKSPRNPFEALHLVEGMRSVITDPASAQPPTPTPIAIPAPAPSSAA